MNISRDLRLRFGWDKPLIDELEQALLDTIFSKIDISESNKSMRDGGMHQQTNLTTPLAWVLTRKIEEL